MTYDVIINIFRKGIAYRHRKIIFHFNNEDVIKQTVQYSVYLNPRSVCPLRLGGISRERSLFMDTQLGSDGSDLCIWREL